MPFRSRSPATAGFFGRLFAAVVFCAAAAGCRTPSPPEAAVRDDAAARARAEAFAHYSRGLSLEWEGRLDEAVAAFREAADRDPENERLCRHLAAAYIRRNRVDDAIAALKSLHEAHPGALMPVLLAGRIRAVARQYPEAEEWLRRAMAMAPTNAVAASELAAVCLRQDRDAEALALLREAMRRGSTAAPLLAPAGELYVRARKAGDEARLREAGALLDELARWSRADADFLSFLGGVYRSAGENDRALDALRRAAEAPGAGAEHCARLASMLVAMQREDDAVRALEDGAEKSDRPLPLLEILARLHGARAQRLQTEPEKARAERERAIEVLRRILRSAPAQDALRLQLGDLLILNGRPAEAVAEFERIEATDLDSRRRLALRFLAAGSVENAIRGLEDVARERPDDAQVAFYLGELHARAGHRDEARAWFDKAARHPSPGPAPFIRLAGLQVREDPRAARSILEGALQRMPDDPALLEALAQTAWEEKDYAEAARTYERLEKRLRAIDVAVPPLMRVHHAMVLAYGGRPDEAAAMLVEAGDGDPLLYEAFVRIAAGADRESKDPSRARAVLERAAAARPDEPLVPMFRGLYEHFSDRHAESIPFFEAAERIAERVPERKDRLTPEFRFWFGAACERAGQFDRAVGLMRTAIAEDAEHADARNYLAYMWAEKGTNLAEALVLVNQALAAQPANGAYLDTRGWIYFRQGRFDEAREEIIRAIAHLPDDPTVTDHLGDILEKQGRHAEAVEKWKRAFVIDPDVKGLREKLAALGLDLAPLEREAAERKAEREKAERDAPPPEDEDLPDEEQDIPGMDINPRELQELMDPLNPDF